MGKLSFFFYLPLLKLMNFSRLHEILHFVCNELRNATHQLKYEKHFPKMYEDVGMAVPKTTQTRYMDGSVQAT